jgi:hypothetical protein
MGRNAFIAGQSIPGGKRKQCLRRASMTRLNDLLVHATIQVAIHLVFRVMFGLLYP